MSTIEFKGIRQGILVTLPEQENWPTISADLAARIDSQREFFRGASIVLQVGQRGIRRHELDSLMVLLEKREVKLIGVLSKSATTQGATRKLNLATDLNELDSIAPAHQPIPDTKAAEPTKAPAMNSTVSGTNGVLIRRTLRSGNTIQHDGHVVVLGDVHPGAEIIAGGDVVVWGHLRGVVHAGAYGNLEAVVCALNLEPTQLRISSLISVSPPRRRRKTRPERAYVENGQIHAEEWSP
jgi:septum site-determining protein MinC